MDKVKVICPFCSCGCTFYILSEHGRLAGIEYAYDVAGAVNEGALCPKANDVSFLVSGRRLTKPLKRTESGEFKEITWQEALSIIVDRIKDAKTAYGPDSIGFLLSVKMFNEEAYAWQKLARLLGTNNVDHECRRMCQAPTLLAGSELMKIGYLTGTFKDVSESDVVVLWGLNAAETFPILMGKYVLKAKEKGAKLVVVDPVKTRTAWYADIYVPVKPGTDLILANSLINVIVSEGLYDKEFVRGYVENFDEVAREASNYPPEKASELCGVPVSLIREMAYTMARAEKGSLLWSAAVVQTWLATELCRSLYTLAALLGWYNKEGCCVGGLKGHNNVDGAIDMGVHPALLPGRVRVADDEARKRVAKAWGVEDLPSKPGSNMVRLYEAIDAGKMRVLYVIGANPVMSEANTRFVEEHLKKLDFLIVQDLFMTETARLADVVLPAAAWAEKSGSFTSVERRVQWSFKALEPPGEAKSDLEVAVMLAKRLGMEDKLAYGSPEEVLEEVRKIVPSYAGLSPERLKKTPQGIHIPCPSEDHPGTRILRVTKFKARIGRYREPPVKPSDEFPYILTTVRVVGSWHTATMTGNSIYLREIWAEPVALVGDELASRLGIKEGSRIKIVTRVGEMVVKAHVTKKIRGDTIALPWHWGANKLTDHTLRDPDSGVPCVKYTPCRVEVVR